MTAKVENHMIAPLVTDKVEDKASHALEHQNISIKVRILWQPIIGTKTDNDRYMPIIGTKTDNDRYMPIIGHLHYALSWILKIAKTKL